MLIIDLNSVVVASLTVGKDPQGTTIDGMHIATQDYGFTNFSTSYKIALEQFNFTPKDTIAVWDTPKARERRQRIHPGYKSHRKPKPDKFYKVFNNLMTEVKDFITDLGGVLCWAKKTEADDVIATIAPRIDNSVVWTKDKDAISIPDTTVYIHGAYGNTYDEDHCDDRFYGVKRKYVRLVRTLLSDYGDFGKGMGAKGFGKQAFLKLWTTYGDDGLDTMIDLIERKALIELEEDVNDIPELQKIIDSADNVYKTWRLAGWFKIPDHKLHWRSGVVKDAHCETYDEDFHHWYGKQTLVTSINFDKIKEEIYQHAENTEFMALDIETDVPENSHKWLAILKKNMSKPKKVDTLASKLCGLSVTLGDNLQHTYYFSVNHAITDNIESFALRDFIMSLDSVPIVAHSASGFELPVLFKNWGTWLPETFDNRIAASYVNENDRWRMLKLLSSTYLNYKQESYDEVTQGKGMSELTAKHVFSYGCDDTITTAVQFNLFTTIMQVEDTLDAFLAAEVWSQYPIAHAFAHGINCDTDLLVRLKQADKLEYDKNWEVVVDYLSGINWPGAFFEPLTEITAAEIKRGYLMLTGEKLKTQFRIPEKVVAVAKDAHEIYGSVLEKGNLADVNAYLEEEFVPRPKFKVNSPKDAKTLFYEILGYPVRYRKPVTAPQRKKGQKLGAPYTDEDALRWMIKADANEEEIKLIEAIIRCKAYVTRNGLYYKPYPLLCHWSDGNIHPDLKLSETTSRRLAPSGPNVDQLPKRTEDGKKVRGCIVPHHENAIIVSPDYKGQELRLAADRSKDPRYISCYVGNAKKDLHAIVGYEICQKQGKEYGSYEQFVIDVANDDDQALAKKYRGKKGKPTNFLTQYGGSAPTLAKKLRIPENETQLFIDAKFDAFPVLGEWIKTEQQEILARKYSTTKLGARRHLYKPLMMGDESHLLRSGLNFEIQSSGAEMTKISLGNIWLEGLFERYDIRLYMPVHDEICFSVDKADAQAFCLELHEIMTRPYADCIVPVECSLNIGPNFADMDEISWEDVDKWIADMDTKKAA